MAFLGKISAVVTANTTDFTKKIEGTKQELLSLKRQLSGYQLNLNSRSLDGTLTKLQKFNRTLQEAAKLSPFERLANGFPDLKRLADQFKAFEDIGKPLTKVKNEIEGLANSAQARLYPELEKVQKGFQRLYNEIDAGTATFDGSRKRVEGLTAALTRLSRVSAAAKDIGGLASSLNANNTGASFFQPGAKAALQRSLELRGKAEQIPARLRGGVFAELAVEAEANAQKIEEQAARVGAAILKAQRNGRFGRSPAGRESIASEQEQLDRLTRQQEVINNQFAREVRSAEIRQIISPEADSLVDRLKTKFQQLAGELRAINGSRFDGVIGSVGSLVEQLNRGEVSAKRVRAAIEGLSKVKAASAVVSSAGEAADKALRSQGERDGRTVREAASFQRQQIRQTAARRFSRLNEAVIQSDDRISSLDSQRQELVALRDAGRLGDDSAISRVESQIATERDRRDRAAQLASRVAAARRSRLAGATVGEAIGLERVAFAGDIANRTKKLSEKEEVSQDPRLQRLAGEANSRSIGLDVELKRIQNLFDSGKTAEARKALKSFGEQADAQVASLDRLERAINGVTKAQERLARFQRESGSRSTKLGETFDRNAGDISLLRNLVGNFDQRAERSGGSDRAKNAIARAVSENERLIRLEGRVLSEERRPGVSKEDFENRQNRRLELIRKAAIRERDQLVEEVSAGSMAGGARGQTTQQIQTILDRNAKNKGSFGARGAAVVQLAAQQGLFAIDDLISSTGGLEYKLRAIGNNITQLGLLLGQSGVIPGLSATAGLAAGLAVVIGGQLASALLRWVTGSKKAEEAAQALNKSISLQKNLIDQISQGYQSAAGDAIARGFSESAAAANQFAKALQNIAKQQSQLKIEQLLVAGSSAPLATRNSLDSLLSRSTQASSVLSGRAALERIDERARTADRPGEIIALQRQRAEIARNELRAAERAAREQSPAGAAVQRALEDASRRLAVASDPRGIAGTADAIASGDFRLGPLLGFGGSAGALTLRATSAQAQRLAAGLPVGQSRDDRQAQVAALDEIIERLKAVPTQEAFGSQTTASTAAEQTIAELERLQVLLRQELGLLDFLRDAAKASRDLAAAQKIASAAVEDSVPGALSLRERLDSYAREIDAANTAIAEANRLFGEGKIEQPDRESVVARQRAIIGASSAGRRLAISEADPLAFSAIVNPGRLLRNRLSDASQRLAASGFGEGEIARRARAIEAERQRATRFIESRRGVDGTIDQLSMQIFEQWNAELNRQAEELQVATRGVEAFADALVRAQREADGNFESARSRADQARREQLGFNSARTRLERDVSAEDEQRSRDMRNQVSDAIAVERARLERQASSGSGPLVDVFRRLEQIGQTLAEGGLTSSQRESLIQERRSLQNRVDAEASSAEEVRRRVDASTAEDERQQAARRGRSLFQTTPERLGEEVAKGVADIGEEVDRRRRRAEKDFLGRGNFDPQGFQAEIEKISRQGSEAASRFVSEQARAAAPAIFSLADSVQNAIVQGPSRAALQATDVSTVEGQRELNRLLRGDDSARDQNIVELEKQNQSLQKLVDLAQEEAKARGIVLDIK